jgi:hypothetical protein
MIFQNPNFFSFFLKKILNGWSNFHKYIKIKRLMNALYVGGRRSVGHSAVIKDMTHLSSPATSFSMKRYLNEQRLKKTAIFLCKKHFFISCVWNI